MKPERPESLRAEDTEEATVTVNHVVSRSGLACWLDNACQSLHQTTAEGHVRCVCVFGCSHTHALNV